MVNIASQKVRGANVKDIDLSFINRRLEWNGRTPDQAEKAVEAYRRMLSLLAENPTITLVPTKEADIAWHEHILFMAKYEEDMNAIFGSVPYHYPDHEKNSLWESSVSRTRSEHLRIFSDDIPTSDFATCYISMKQK